MPLADHEIMFVVWLSEEDLGLTGGTTHVELTLQGDRSDPVDAMDTTNATTGDTVADALHNHRSAQSQPERAVYPRSRVEGLRQRKR